MPHIPQKEFVKEHKRLIQVLRKGSQQDQEREAQRQAKELKSNGIVQSVILSRDHFKNLDEAKRWLHEHEYRYVTPDITPHYFRFRQHEPVPHRRYRSIELKDTGYLIMSYAK
jgi:hypothetical protein